MSKRMYVKIVIFMSIFCLTACVSLRTGEKYQYKSLEKRLAAVGLEPESSKDPALAGALNILPGIGNIYLGQWGIFALNLLFWPISIAWGVPQAAVDAGTINKQDTVYFYTFAEGKQALEQKEIQNGLAAQSETAKPIVVTAVETPTAVDFCKLGDKALFDKDYDGAIECYNKALLKDPKVADIAYKGLGDAFRTKDDNKSISYYQLSARLGNKNAQQVLHSHNLDW